MTSASASALTDLLARVRAATGPDRNLDGSIEGLVTSSDWDCVIPYALPHYTSSIDAAVALAERVLPGKLWNVEATETYRAQVSLSKADHRHSAALALLAAIISALITKDQSP